MTSSGPRFTVHVGDRTVELTRLDKVLWPGDGYTKADLIEYYTVIAPVLLPHLKDRPLTFTRHPDGIDNDSFYQKNVPAYAPAWLSTYCAADTDHNTVGHSADVPPSKTTYVLADEPAALLWLANQGCIGVHPWLSTVHSPGTPDQIVIDLDPNPPAGFEEARRIAFVVRDVLTHMGLRGYPKVSGATGVHVYVPVAPRHPHGVTGHLADFISRIVSELLPEAATNERRIHRRGARVYVDPWQNLPGQTIAAPYSLRPLPGAPVSTPVTWDELHRCRPEDFTIKTVPDRVNRLGDVFAAVLTDMQDISTWIDELA